MKSAISFLVLTLVFNLSVQAEVMKVKSMNEVGCKIEEVLKDHNPWDVLLALDIDMTLTQPDHPAVFYPALKKYKEDFKRILSQLTPEQKDLVPTLTTQLYPQRWVEKETPQIIKNIIQQGVKTIAFTAALSGKIGGFKNKLIIRKRDQLQKMGLDFDKSFREYTSAATYFDFKKYAGSYPMYYHGVLSANGEGQNSKGDVFTAFLKHIGHGYHPKVVILVDDRTVNVETVEAALKTHDPTIKFIGITYEGAYTYAPQEISREDFQAFWVYLS